MLSSRTSRQVRPEFGLPIYENFRYGSMSYHDPFRAGEREEEEDKTRGRGVCFCCPASPHQVRPESGLSVYDMKAYRITTLSWAESGKERKREHGGCCMVSE